MVRRLLLICGIGAPLGYAASDIMSSMRYEGYSYVDQTISELNAIGAPTRPLTIALGLVTYALLIGFGVGIWKSAAGDRGLRAAGAVLGALGVLSLWAVPYASMEVRGAAQGSKHLVEGTVAVLLLVTAMGFAGAKFGTRFRIYTIATVVVMLAFGGWTAMDGSRLADGLDTPWLGVKERISVYAYQLWLVVLALTLLRRGERASVDGAASGDASMTTARA